MSFNMGEELYILALDESKGQIYPDAFLLIEPGLAGALANELEVRTKIKKTGLTFKVLDTKPTGDALLDKMLQHVIKWKSPYTFFNLQAQVRRQLARKGILNLHEATSLRLIPGKITFKDISIRGILKESVRKFLLNDVDPSDHLIGLCGFLKLCHLMRFIFTEDELASIRLKIDDYSRFGILIIKNKELADLWKEAKTAYDNHAKDRFLRMAFTVFEKLLNSKYQEFTKDHSINKPMPQKIDILCDKNQIDMDRNRLKKIWHWRTEHVHDGMDFSDAYVDELKVATEKLIELCVESKFESE